MKKWLFTPRFVKLVIVFPEAFPDIEWYEKGALNKNRNLANVSDTNTSYVDCEAASISVRAMHIEVCEELVEKMNT